MEKKIKPYRQRSAKYSMQTCGSSCVLMLLDYYGRVSYPTLKMEEKFYRRYRVAGYKGMTGAAVANCLSFPGNNLEVHLVQSFVQNMENRGDLFSPEEYEMLMASHRKHLAECKDRIQLSAGVNFDPAFLRQELEKGKKIILETFVPEVEDGPPKVLHWVVVESYNGETGHFRIRDPLPLREPYDLTAQELLSYMDTPIGRICIVTGGTVYERPKKGKCGHQGTF